MNTKVVKVGSLSCAIIECSEAVICNGQAALDLIMTVQYETGCDRLILDKQMFSEEFFILSTGLAGEILQKFINYKTKLAIVGDFSKYTSKPLKDFIYESNKGNDVFFVTTQQQAIENLTANISLKKTF